jgi:hypothetical protein
MAGGGGVEAISRKDGTIGPKDLCRFAPLFSFYRAVSLGDPGMTDVSHAGMSSNDLTQGRKQAGNGSEVTDSGQHHYSRYGLHPGNDLVEV